MKKNSTNSETLYTVTVYSENQVGLLNQISNTFTRRSLNIWSLSVSASAMEGVHKFTITTRTTHDMIEKVVKQIEKRIDVVKAFYYTDDEIIFKEIALYKVDTDNLLNSGDFEGIVSRNNARIVEMNRSFAVILKTGNEEETQKLYKELSKFGVRQFVRSGRISVSKSMDEPVNSFIKMRDMEGDKLQNAEKDIQ
ncbi:MAG: acetolactate synthase small subunit [Candidatus Egerieousia sp.]